MTGDGTASSSRTGEVFRLIRRDILSGALAGGERLRSTMLRARYGAGLTPVREALARLAGSGLVTGQEQHGFRVVPTSEEDLRDITRVSVLTESDAIVRAVERADGATDAALLRAFEALAGTPMRSEADTGGGVHDAWSEAHRRFHESLIAPCGSSWLLQLNALLFDHAERYRQLAFRVAPDRDLVDEHRRLLDAVLGRDPARAAALVDAHWSATAEAVLASGALRSGGDGSTPPLRKGAFGSGAPS
ncbi:GntR family transcriptional regulator [uncultured Amnibacterium sp.]|uniref:GntR family transcriptional regulator n=1 Tax=uncultured Amnibacterium sp. TaxID=1631851 RepID=UPI0035CA1E64